MEFEYDFERLRIDLLRFFEESMMFNQMAMLNIVDILFSAVASETYSSIKNYLDKTREAIAYRKH